MFFFHFDLGEFGLVYKGVWTLKDLPVAVKTLRGGASDEQRDNFLFEASGNDNVNNYMYI